MSTLLEARAECEYCSEPIAFVITARARLMPVDPAPNPEGNVAVMRDAGGRLISRVVSRGNPCQPWETLYMPHFATCLERQKARHGG